MVQQRKETRRCVICGGEFYVTVIKMHNVQLSFENGIQASHTDPPIVLCEQHFYSEIWNKKKGQT